MKIISETAMKKKIEQGCPDLFDLLRMLNSTNINENKILRDALFTALSVVKHPGDLAISYYYNKELNAKYHYNDLGSVTEIEGPTPESYDYYMLLTHIAVESYRLKIKDNYVLLDLSTCQANGSYDSWITSLLLYIENYIKISPWYFNEFKLKLIEIIIKNICCQCTINYANVKDKEREKINKLMNILLEHRMNLEPTKDYQDLITPELFEQIKSEIDRNEHGQIVIDYVEKTYCQKPLEKGNGKK